ncbi:MAG TPA: DUF4432 family protein, partial [Capsulimonadaceae bacterium]|nr:DUF4432 family protein [Capsulimonadaceae bacterium]
DSGTHLVGNVVEISPRDEEAAQGQDRALFFEEPAPGYKEKVYFLTPADEETQISLVNEKLPLRVTFLYNRKELTHLTEWKMMGEGAYVVGVEPGNCHPISIAEARKKNDLQFLAPGEKKSFGLTIKVDE